jgi:hypothetical protein
MPQPSKKTKLAKDEPVKEEELKTETPDSSQWKPTTLEDSYSADVITTGEVDLYETDHRLVAPDIVICVEHPFIVPANRRNTTKRLKKGDRIRGKYYVDMVMEDKIEGLQLARLLPEAFLEKLEDIRRERTGAKPPQWAIEAQALRR